jgi:hypothetical protein
MATRSRRTTSHRSIHPNASASAMVRISFLYPNSKDTHFDFDSYVEKHMPWSIDFSARMRVSEVSRQSGVLATGRVWTSHSWRRAIFFEKLDDFMNAVAPHLAALHAYMRNYTDIEPTFQVSEVVINR